MRDPSPTIEALGRAARRAGYHLLQAVIESLKAVEAVIEEVGAMSDHTEHQLDESGHKIEIE